MYVFNSSKCAICQSQIFFRWCYFLVQGMRTDPAKVQALQDLPAPENLQKLQWILGLINYLQPFSMALHLRLPLLESK